MLDLINRPLGVRRDLLEAHPDQDGTPDMIAHDASLPTLATFQAGQLFGLSMKLLNLPTPATHLLRGRRVLLSPVVGDDVVRALGGQHNPEQFHLVILGKAFDFNHFAVRQVIGRPVEAIDALVRLLISRVIHLAIVFERTVEYFVQLVHIQHQVFGGIPGVHQHSPKPQLFVIDGIRQHVPHVLQFALAIAVWIVDPVVDDPKLLGRGVDIDTGDYANPLDQTMGVATVLATNQFNPLREILVDDRVIEDQITLVDLHHLPLHVLPDQAGRDLVARQVAVDGIVAEVGAVFGKVGQRVVDLATQQILTVIQASDRIRSWVHSPNLTRTSALLSTRTGTGA